MYEKTLGKYDSEYAVQVELRVYHRQGSKWPKTFFFVFVFVFMLCMHTCIISRDQSGQKGFIISSFTSNHFHFHLHTNTNTNTNTNMNKTNKNTQEKICYVISVDG